MNARNGRGSGSGRGNGAGSGRGEGGGAASGRNRAGQGRTGASAGRTGAKPARPAGAGKPKSGGAAKAKPTKPALTQLPGRLQDRRPRGEAAPPMPADLHVPDGVRLQKVLAQAGYGSRRACEELIDAGRVTVDGYRVTELGLRVDPQRAVIHVDGMRVQLDETLVYLALNKPRGVVSTMDDPQGRPNLGDYVADRTERLFHVGRLDAETEGLILLTNDGELSHRLAHPSYSVPKTYLAEIQGQPARDLGKQLRAGVQLEDGPARVDSFKMIDARPGKALVELVLHEGRNHIVRRLLAEVGHPVLQLVRVQVGPVRLGDLKTGRLRALSREELGTLLAEVGM
ncbi:MAG: pseudouridine synthase [Kineosporiaceae bacterium]